MNTIARFTPCGRHVPALLLTTPVLLLTTPALLLPVLALFICLPAPSAAQSLVRTRQVRLHSGVNLVSIPLAARTTDNRPLDAGDLLAMAGATFIARVASDPDSPAPRFRVWTPGMGRSPFALEPARGYLLNVRIARTLTFRGPAWNVSTLRRAAARGLASVALSRGVPPGERARGLLTRPARAS